MINNVLKNIDYFHVFKNGKVVLMLGNELDGKTKTELQQEIGNRLGNGTYTYSMKYLNDAKNYRGKIRGFSLEEKNNIKESEDMTDPALVAVLGKLAENLSNKHDENNFSAQLEKFYKLQMDFQKEQILKLEKELEKIKKENEAGSGGIDLSTLMSLQNMITGTKPQGQSFQSNVNPVGIKIPGAIIQVLRKVDFSKMDEKTKNDLANSLAQYIQYVKLPLINENNFQQTTIEETLT